MSSRTQQREKKRREKRQRKKEKDRVQQTVSPMPPEQRIRRLPYIVLKLLTGANIAENYKLNKDAVAIIWDNDTDHISSEDFKIAQKIADELFKEQVKEKSLMPTINTLPVGMMLHRLATQKIERMVRNETEGKKKILFIKDRSGCGYWRMLVPSRYMDAENLYIDITESELVFDFLLEYDTIVIQRLCNWREYYIIERLKRHGKRIVYDIDDDIFDVPVDNPAARYVKKDQHKAAYGIMRLCDAVTTTSEILKERLKCPETTVVIPNAIDLEDGYPAKYRQSEDGIKRIVWMGGGSHSKDWLECFEAVDKILQEREDVRLVIYGDIPRALRAALATDDKPWFTKRIEFVPFQAVETYVELTKETTADCALAPLSNESFNAAKSNIKWLEYTAMGVPTVASNVSPYKEHIDSGRNGVLVSNTDEWYRAITAFLDDPELCANVVDEAVKSVDERFDVKKIVHDWEEVILGHEMYSEENQPQLVNIET